MDAIVGIVKTCLEPVATKLGEYIVEPFNYLYCFNSNIQNLSGEVEELKKAREGLKEKVRKAKDKVEVIVHEVTEWLKNADDLVEVQWAEIEKSRLEVDESRVTNIQSCFLAIKSRYSLSRKAKKATEAMKELRGRCDFNPIADPVTPAAMKLIPQESTSEFDSRKHIEEDIVTNLKDEKVNMIGICGMGGVGKTTTAKRIANRVWKHLFDEIVMVVVSQQVERLKIQDEIAKSLDLTLGEGCLAARARILHARLHARLVGGKKILIILDDVWEKLILGDDLGIPCESGLERCKILLTSRNSEILNQMKVQKVYELKVLSETEAWNLFKSNVGTWIEDHDVLSVAQEVVKECKGLPIALVVVGAALKDKKNRPIWTDVLRQLQKANPTAMPNILNGVYKPLRLSYEYLKNEQAESLFLLCCLFREDGYIPLEYLAVYAMGLRMFEDIEDLEQARNRTETLVEMLKSRFLLLEGWDEDDVRMHDVVRDVSIFIASEERRINCNNCSWISPFLRKRIKLPIPELRLLLIDEWADKELEIKDNFFEGMSGLNVLSMKDVSGRSLPHTTHLLKNLRTLLLLRCTSLETISVVGKLESLEILICRNCDSIENVPVEIGGLNHLKLLEFSSCKKLKTIVPGVISRLVELEELKMVKSFDKWEAEDKGTERKNATLSELESLSKLTCLEIEIKDYTLAAEQINLPSKIVKYDIRIDYCRDSELYSALYSELYQDFEKMSKEFEKKMYLHLPSEITLGNWIYECVRSVECIWLKGDGSNSLDLGQAQNTIRSLDLRGCSTVKKLMNITSRITTVFPRLESLKLFDLPKLEEICDGPIPEGSPNSAFKNLKDLRLEGLPALKHLWKNPNQNVVSLFGNNLSSISIEGCHSLHNLSSLALAKDCLLQLESLYIRDCKMMEQVLLLWNEEENGKNITFPKLKSLQLRNLPNLTTFCKGIESIEFPLLTSLAIDHCPKLKSVVSSITSSTGNNQNNSEGTSHNHGHEFFNLFYEPKKAKDCLLQLESLVIRDCEMMEQVLLWNEEENGKDITFPKLKSLTLWNLPNLTTFCKGIESIKFPLLTSLKINSYPQLKSVVASSTTSSIRNNNQNNSEGTSHNHNHDSFHLFCEPEKVAFGSLKKLHITANEHPILTLWCHQISFGFFTGLEELEISGFDNIRSLFSSSIAGNLVNLNYLEISHCGKMVKVIEDDEEKDACGGESTICLFPMLKWLTLSSLSNLKIFWEWRCALELPALEYLEITECPQMERFTLGSLTTPNLKEIEIDSKIINNMEGLNGTLERHFFRAKEKSTFGEEKEEEEEEGDEGEEKQEQEEMEEKEREEDQKKQGEIEKEEN